MIIKQQYYNDIPLIPTLSRKGRGNNKETRSQISRRNLSPLEGEMVRSTKEGATNGFTLIELLVVVLIIGILAAVALPQYQKAVEKARAVEILSNVNTLSKTAEMYFLSGRTDTIEIDDLEIDLGGGQIHGVDYYTKTAGYYFYCTSIESGSFCGIETYRKNCYTGNTLDPDNCDNSNLWSISRGWKNGKITSNICVTQSTSTGRTICKWLESQGFEYVDGDM